MEKGCGDIMADHSISHAKSILLEHLPSYAANVSEDDLENFAENNCKFSSDYVVDSEYLNPYRSPDLWGCEMICNHDLKEDEYSYDIVTVLHSSGGFYIGTDSGCSCPSPFENYRSLSQFTGPLSAEQCAEEYTSLWFRAIGSSGDSSYYNASDYLLGARRIFQMSSDESDIAGDGSHDSSSKDDSVDSESDCGGSPAIDMLASMSDQSIRISPQDLRELMKTGVFPASYCPSDDRVTRFAFPRLFGYTPVCSRAFGIDGEAYRLISVISDDDGFYIEMSHIHDGSCEAEDAGPIDADQCIALYASACSVSGYAVSGEFRFCEAAGYIDDIKRIRKEDDHGDSIYL